MSHDSPLPAAQYNVQRSRVAERLLIPAAFITTAGNAFQITAAAILVFRAGQSTLSVGWLFIAVSIPQVALSIVFGRMTDRFDRRTLSVLSDLISAATAFALPVWLWMHQSTTLGSYLCNFLLACSAALFLPASNALVKERVREERLVKYNAAFETATNAGMLLASSTAGFLVVVFGATPLFVFNAGTFILSAALTYFIGRKPEQPAESGTETKAAAQVDETADADAQEAAAPQTVAAPAARPVQPPIRRLGLLFTSGNINLMVANVILTALILRTFHQSAWLVGVTDALAGAGFIVGATCHGWIAKRFSSLQIAVGCSMVCCLTIVLEPLGYIVLMCVIPFAGFFFVNFRIAARTMLMKASPQERVGRIFGEAQAFGLALGIAATLALSTLADSTSVPVAFYCLAGLLGVIVISCGASLVKPLAAAKAATEAEAAAESGAAPAETEPVAASAAAATAAATTDTDHVATVLVAAAESAEA
jgi:MFS family permease